MKYKIDVYKIPSENGDKKPKTLAEYSKRMMEIRHGDWEKHATQVVDRSNNRNENQLRKFKYGF